MPNLHLRTLSVLVACALSALATGCGADPAPESGPEEPDLREPSVRAVDAAEARLAVTYDGGVLVVRASDGRVLADEPMDGFLRLNPAGDERHVFVSAPGGFTALDLGAWTSDHGDHGHSYVDEPALTDFTVPAVEPGHVVAHEGRTTLFDDGTGAITSFETYELAALDQERPALTTRRTDSPHHGVALRDHEGRWMETVGTVEERTGIRVLSPSGKVLATSDECPGVHGEAFARDVAAFGCEDGVLLVAGTRITKVDAPGGYARIGNQAGSETSPYVLGDFKSDADAALERPERISVINTRDASIRLVDLGTSYSFRSLGRTPSGDGLVLGTDGSLHLIDTERALVAVSLPVVDAWREPMDWERPRPTLEVVGETAVVTEPATREVHLVDLRRMRVTTSYELPEVPNEVVGVTG